MIIHRIPTFIQKLFPDFIWSIDTIEKAIYLSFDDGPVPEVTPWVLDILASFGAKATFFCVGDNVKKHPEIFQRILTEGHQVGNHTQHHLNGWKTPLDSYLKDTEEANAIMQQFTESPLRYFRPPYGRMRMGQAKALKQSYDIVMWEVLTADYDPTLSAKSCLANSIRATRSGSVVVFHDHEKCFSKLQKVLPAYLSHFQQLGYSFQRLP
ncbi:polysaccharide deacetylase family protein [Penaeicola halotolerans]|uniref:polysaccharide deacetylase family protein n=1 Tax=Penaeicola halotolerans TaxID=2793196 RepID=UPI001CF8B3C5|nr:polysaccharide deacetylase family protein [Penaeicola halotolerans]